VACLVELLIAGIARARLRTAGSLFERHVPSATGIRGCRVNTPGYQLHVFAPKSPQHGLLATEPTSVAPPSLGRIEGFAFFTLRLIA